MAKEISDELLDFLLSKAMLAIQLGKLDNGKYYQLAASTGGNPFAIAKSNPGSSIAIAVQMDRVTEGTVVWKIKDATSTSTGIPGSLNQTWDSEFPLSPLAADGGSEEGEEELGDVPDWEPPEPCDPSGEFHLTWNTETAAAMDLRITPPGKDDYFIAIIHKDGRVEVPDKQTEAALLKETSQVEIRMVSQEGERARNRSSHSQKTSSGCEETPPALASLFEDASPLPALAAQDLGGPEDSLDETVARRISEPNEFFGLFHAYITRLCKNKDRELIYHNKTWNWEDLRQEVYIKLLSIGIKKDPSDQFTTDDGKPVINVLPRIVHNTAVDLCRIDKAKKRGGDHTIRSLSTPLEGEDSLLQDIIQGKDVRPEERAQLKEAIHILVEAIAELPAEHQRLLKMKYWDCMKEPEIAVETGQSTQAVKNQLNRIRAKLKQKLLAKLGDDHSDEEGRFE